MPKSDRGAVHPERLFSRFSLVDLELFTAIAEAGSITHGARRARLSLPSASARVRALEQVLGTALLARGRRGVTLTPAGTLLRRHALNVLADLDRMYGDLARYADGLTATVRLLANTAAASTLPGDLIAYLDAHPDVDLDLEERPSPLIVEALAQGRADLGIIASTAGTGRLETSPLREDRLVIAAPAGHLLTRRDRVAFADCLDQPFVGLAEGTALYEHLEGHARPLGRQPRYRIRAPGIEAACQAVAAGIGISVLPQAAVIRYRRIHPVEIVALSDDWASRQLLLCSNPARSLSQPARALLAHLRALPADRPGRRGPETFARIRKRPDT